MRLLMIVHQDDSGPGVFLDVINDSGADQVVWHPAQETAPPGEATEYDAIFSFGGEAHPVQDAEYPWLATERRFLAGALEWQVPLLGVCLGSQLIAQAAGARALRAPRPEIGWYEVSMTPEATLDPLLGPLAGAHAAGRFDALQWHSYRVELPAGATALAVSDICLQSYRIGSLVWGIQFHAEVTEHDFEHWLEVDGSGADAVEIGLDVAAVLKETRARMGAWNELGRGLCERFLTVAAAR